MSDISPECSAEGQVRICGRPGRRRSAGHAVLGGAAIAYIRASVRRRMRISPQPTSHHAMKNSRLVLSACCLAMLSVGDNNTAIMAALPAMMRDLHLESAAIEWLVNAYLLAAAVFILLGGEAA